MADAANEEGTILLVEDANGKYDRLGDAEWGKALAWETNVR